MNKFDFIDKQETELTVKYNVFRLTSIISKDTRSKLSFEKEERIEFRFFLGSFRNLEFRDIVRRRHSYLEWEKKLYVIDSSRVEELKSSFRWTVTCVLPGQNNKIRFLA